MQGPESLTDLKDFISLPLYDVGILNREALTNPWASLFLQPNRILAQDQKSAKCPLFSHFFPDVFLPAGRQFKVPSTYIC